MDRKRMFSLARALCFLATVTIVGLAGCGDKEGDVLAPSLSSNAENVFYVVSDSVMLKVDVEVGAEIEVAVADGLVAGLPIFEGTSAVGDTWSFVVSSLLPGANAVAVTARDATGNQQTLFMTVTYDFLTVDRWVTPVASGTTSYEVRGTVADGVAPVVIVDSATAPPLVPAITVVVTPDSDPRRWIATFDVPANPDQYTVSVARNDGTQDVTKDLTLTASDADYPLAAIDTQLFEIVETAPGSEDPVNRVDDKLLLAGDCQDGATVTLLLNNTEQVVDTTTVPGRWSSAVTLRPGKNFITLTVTDDSLAVPLTTTARDAIRYVLP